MNDPRVEHESHEPQTGAEFHRIAEDAREEKNFTVALEFGGKAIAGYQMEGNKAKEAEAHAGRALTKRHLADYDKAPGKDWLKEAKEEAQTADDIIRNAGLEGGALVRPLYTLGKVNEKMEDWPAALEQISEACELMSYGGPEDKLPGEAAEMNTRLAAIQFRLGDAGAEQRFGMAVSELGEMPESYERFVWLSGAHMHMAEAYSARGSNQSAMEELDVAKSVLDSSPKKYNLIIRREQLEALVQKISYNL